MKLTQATQRTRIMDIAGTSDIEFFTDVYNDIFSYLKDMKRLYGVYGFDDYQISCRIKEFTQFVEEKYLPTPNDVLHQIDLLMSSKYEDNGTGAYNEDEYNNYEQYVSFYKYLSMIISTVSGKYDTNDILPQLLKAKTSGLPWSLIDHEYSPFTRVLFRMYGISNIKNIHSLLVDVIEELEEEDATE